jgi:hypothetical protein
LAGPVRRQPAGTAEDPASQADLDAKFRDFTAAVLGPDRSAELLRSISDGDLDTPAALVTLLVRR